MPSVWDHKADKDLLLTIIEDGNLTHINWQSVATKLQTKDYTFSHEACRQHYQKIRKESRNNASINGADPVSTPTKAAALAKSTPASKRKGNKSFNNSFNEDDEEDLDASPSAKRRRSAKKEKPEPQDMGGFAGQTAAQFKVEEFGGGNNGESYHSAVDLLDEGIYAV